MRPAEVILRTTRLCLRPWQRPDLEVMASWAPFTDPLDRVWNWPQQLRANGTLDMFFASQSTDPTRAAWTILERVDHRMQVAGLLQLKQIQHAESSAELGIALGASWIGCGYGREALAAFLPAYFGVLKFSLLRLEVSLANRRARRLYETLGFGESSRFWRYAGSAEEYRFLDAPAYRDLRAYFRWANNGVYQQCAELELSAAERRGTIHL